MTVARGGSFDAPTSGTFTVPMEDAPWAVVMWATNGDASSDYFENVYSEGRLFSYGFACRQDARDGLEKQVCAGSFGVGHPAVSGFHDGANATLHHADRVTSWLRITAWNDDGLEMQVITATSQPTRVYYIVLFDNDGQVSVGATVQPANEAWPEYQYTELGFQPQAMLGVTLSAGHEHISVGMAAADNPVGIVLPTQFLSNHWSEYLVPGVTGNNLSGWFLGPHGIHYNTEGGSFPIYHYVRAYVNWLAALYLCSSDPWGAFPGAGPGFATVCPAGGFNGPAGEPYDYSPETDSEFLWMAWASEEEVARVVVPQFSFLEDGVASATVQKTYPALPDEPGVAFFQCADGRNLMSSGIALGHYSPEDALPFTQESMHIGSSGTLEYFFWSLLGWSHQLWKGQRPYPLEIDDPAGNPRIRVTVDSLTDTQITVTSEYSVDNIWFEDGYAVMVITRGEGDIAQQIIRRRNISK